MTSKNYLSIYAKSFNWAGFFLPKETYKKCSALYDFCRVIDNIADEKNQIKIKQNKFEEFKNNFNKKNFNDSIIENMWKLINEFKKYSFWGWSFTSNYNITLVILLFSSFLL